MKKRQTNIVDEYLSSLNDIKEGDTKDFFYARLAQRMKNDIHKKEWVFPLQPAYMIAILTVLLIVNTFMITQKTIISDKKQTASIESFANGYDFHISSY